MTSPERQSTERPYEPIDGLYDALGQYKIEAMLDGSVTADDLVYTAYSLAGRSTIGCHSDHDLCLLAEEVIEELRQEHGARG